MNSNLAIFVMSCDRYDDTWQPFLHFFDKYWPDCPFKVYFASNFRSPINPRIVPILYNQNSTWSDELKSALTQVEESHIMFVQDDYFLLKRVDSNRIVRLFEKMLEYHAVYLRLFPVPGCKKVMESDSEMGILNHEDEYRTSLQTAIWDKAYFLSLIRSGESPWEFETLSPSRAIEGGGLFLSVPRLGKGKIEKDDNPITYFCTAILKGRWMRGAYRLCRKEGIKLDTRRRKLQSIYMIVKSRLLDFTPRFLKKYVAFVITKMP